MRYSLAGAAAPLAVASYTYDTLPPTLRELLPTYTDLVTALTNNETGSVAPAGHPN